MSSPIAIPTTFSRHASPYGSSTSGGASPSSSTLSSPKYIPVHKRRTSRESSPSGSVRSSYADDHHDIPKQSMIPNTYTIKHLLQLSSSSRLSSEQLEGIESVMAYIPSSSPSSQRTRKPKSSSPTSPSAITPTTGPVANPLTAAATRRTRRTGRPRSNSKKPSTALVVPVPEAEREKRRHGNWGWQPHHGVSHVKGIDGEWRHASSGVVSATA